MPPHRALARLARRRRWLAGIALAVAAYGWQATALAFGPLALVAPVGATDLVSALALAAWWFASAPAQAGLAWVRARGGPRRVLSCRLSPSPGRSAASAAGGLAAFTAVTVIAILAAGAGLVARGTVRAGLLAAAGGAVFGLAAAVTLSFTRLLGDVRLVPGPGQLGTLDFDRAGDHRVGLSVAAYQAGSLAASLPVIDTVEPIASVVIGTMVFGEHLAGWAGSMMIQFTAAAAGIFLLSPSAANCATLMARTRAGTAQAQGQPIPDSYRADRLSPVLTHAGHPVLYRLGNGGGVTVSVGWLLLTRSAT